MGQSSRWIVRAAVSLLILVLYVVSQTMREVFSLVQIRGGGGSTSTAVNEIKQHLPTEEETNDTTTILKRLRRGEDIVVVMLGGSVATGAHSPGGLAGAYAARFVERLNAKYANNDDNSSTSTKGKFVLYNMAHGCTHTFYSAVAMPSFVPRNASIILWGHNENDVTYSPTTTQLMMRLYLHATQLMCPTCLLGFAYTMRYGSFPGDNRNFNLQRPAELLQHFHNGTASRVFVANLGEYVRRHGIQKINYAKDGVHITDECHAILGGLLADAAASALEASSSSSSSLFGNDTVSVVTRNQQVAVQTSRSKTTKQEEESSYGLFYDLFLRATSMQSVCADEPTLDEIDHAQYAPNFKRDPMRHDTVRYVTPASCSAEQVLWYNFTKQNQESDVLIGLGLFGDYQLNVSGRAIVDVVELPECWQTCAHSRDWNIWKYHEVNGTNVHVKICAMDNRTANLRYISFLEIPRNARPIQQVQGET